MGATKPTRVLDWISDDSPSKYTVPSAGEQLAGHISGTNANPLLFNWMWWRVSNWLEFLDNTFDSNGNYVYAPNSTKITETVAPTASTVTLDAGGIKSWDGSSNAIFSVTEAGAVTLGYSGNDVISLTAGVLSVGTATSADLVKLHAITASAANINQLTGNTFGGSSAGDVVTIDGTQTLTNKTLTTPKVNEAVNLTATSTELNQLDGVSVGGSSAGDIVTIDGTQTLTNKTISFTQIGAGTAAAGRTFTITGHDTTPANFAFQGSSRYTQVSCNAAGTTFSVLPSATSTVDFYIGNSSYRPTNLYLYAGSGAATIDTGSGGIVTNTTGTLDLNGAVLDVDVTGNATITAGTDNSVALAGGTNSAGNNYAELGVNVSDLGNAYIQVRNNTNLNAYWFDHDAFYTTYAGTVLGESGNRWGTIYGTNLNVTSASGDAILINDSVQDAINIDSYGRYGIYVATPGASPTTKAAMLFETGCTADPSSPVEGMLIYRSDTHTFKYYTGAAWLTFTAA